jgi:uncharacterized membrane protein YfcA
MSELFGLAGLFIAALLAGAVNAIAGGGSLISFPSLVAYGVLQKLANTTNNAALVPGAIAGMFGFWDEVKQQRRLLLFLFLPSLTGGLLGAFLLARTPDVIFQRIVPFLILFATLLFAARDWFTRLAKANPNEEHITFAGGVGGLLFQLVIATYGGYFGAGQSIMMMASLSIMGLRDIHRINGLKTAQAVVINSIAMIYFISQGLVIWNLAILMGIGAIIGGFSAARLSKRVDQKMLRWAVIVIGLIVSAVLFLRQ